MAALQLKTHLFLAFRTGRQEKLIPIRRQQQRLQQPLQSSACPAREVRDLGKNPEEPGVRPPAAPAWMALVHHGAPPSPGQIQFICQLVAKSALSAAGCGPRDVQPGTHAACGLPIHYPPAHTLLTITLAKGHRLGPSPSGNSQPPATHPAKDGALVGAEIGNCC